MKLSIIIVNYNVQYFLEQALLSVRKAAANMEVEIFVVDNNSVDDSVTIVREKFSEVHLIANKHNPGFSVANNQAIELSTGEYILLLNPDTVVQEDTFQKCVDFMDSHADAGGLGVKMIDGSGNFLPESKRGFPSPWVAFCKTFGLSKIFPRSKKFNHYHLGYLNEEENHQVEVLAGAFMLVRKSVIEEIGMLDETFFMYGEDIDWSYRITKAGYKNYYLAETSIIHYKGESTKKGSLNYVRVFYNAMIIFAKKHFTGNSAKGFIFMLQLAIYFRAFLTLASSFFQRTWLPILDSLLIVSGLHFIKQVWATNYYHDPNYYQNDFYYFNIPLYLVLWLGSMFFSGVYDEQFSFRRITKGLIIGTVLIAAVYGFLPLDRRPSRAIILFAAVWSIFSLVSLRVIIHFLKFGNFEVEQSKTQNLIIVGSKNESERVLNLLHKSQIGQNFIGIVSPIETEDSRTFLSSFSQLGEVVQIYKIDEIIFCARDVSNEHIMNSMTKLGSKLNYKIVPKESISIIGSNSKNTTGDLYTVDIQYLISRPMAGRNKRLFDFMVSLFLILLLPIFILFQKEKLNFLRNILQVLVGKKSWVGYAKTTNHKFNLPKIKPAVLSPLDVLNISEINEPTIERLNFLYAKDWKLGRDLEIILKGLKNLDRKLVNFGLSNGEKIT